MPYFRMRSYQFQSQQNWVVMKIHVLIEDNFIDGTLCLEEANTDLFSYSYGYF